MADERRPQPRLTPFSLRVAGESCARWLDLQLHAYPDPEEPFHRWNVRIPLLTALAEAHRTLTAPTANQVRRAPRGLLPEEQWYYAHFVDVYCEQFSTEPASFISHGCDRATPLPRRAVELGGAVDLLVHDANGRIELRQFELWNRELEDEPLASWEMTLALLRLRQSGRVQGPIHVVHADLNSGQRVDFDVDLGSGGDSDLPQFADRLDSTLGDIRSRIETPIPVAGSSCGFCNKVGDCEEWSHRLPLPPRLTDPSPFVGRIVPLAQ